MNTEEKDKLLSYAIKMIERGDRFADILLYLDRKNASAELKKEIIVKLEEHRRLLESREAKKKLHAVSPAKIVFGILFFALTLYLQYLGVIAFPWTLLGFVAAIGALIEVMKLIINIFKRRKP
jgi:hypothetical protein